jgi:hypothetical protein
LQWLALERPIKKPVILQLFEHPFGIRAASTLRVLQLFTFFLTKTSVSLSNLEKEAHYLKMPSSNTMLADQI